MRQSELHELPPRVRERYNQLPANFFDERDEVIQLRRELAEAETRFKIPQARLSEHRQRQVDLLAKREETQREVAQIDADGPALPARLLLAGDPLTEDDKAQERRAGLCRVIERITVALPEIEAAAKPFVSDVSVAAGAREGIGDKLAALLERLRIEEAYRCH